MKTLFVFLAMWILYGTMLVYQSDFMRMNMIEWELDRIARQSASGAIQFFMKEPYGEGYMIVDETAINQFEEELLQEEIKNSEKLSEGNLTLKLLVYEKETLPDGSQSQKVSARAEYEEDDFFRLSFLEKKGVSRQICYEVKGR